jgi:hypothetical protein
MCAKDDDAMREQVWSLIREILKVGGGSKPFSYIPPREPDKFIT